MTLMSERSHCRFYTVVSASTMVVAVAAMAAAGQGDSARKFNRTLKKNDVTFAVSSGNDGSRPTVGVTATASGGTTTVSRQVDGAVTRAEVADLDGDLAPEIYVWVQSTGSGSYGSLVGYVADRQAALSEISMPTIEGDARVSDGYMGHDEFRILRTNDLVRSFPVYRPGDANARPTGGRRTLYYALERDETGSWALRVVRVVNEAR